MEIKCGCEVSPCQKQPSLCQLPYNPPPLLSQQALKLKAKLHSLSRSQRSIDLDTNVGTFLSAAIIDLPEPGAPSNQQILNCTMKKYSPSSDNRRVYNQGRYHSSPVLSSDHYLKENICPWRELLPYLADVSGSESTRAFAETDNKHTSQFTSGGNTGGSFSSDAATKASQEHHAAFSDVPKVFPLNGSRACCRNAFEYIFIHRLARTKPSNVPQTSVPAGRLLSVKCRDAQLSFGAPAGARSDLLPDGLMSRRRQAVTGLAYKRSVREITAFS